MSVSEDKHTSRRDFLGLAGAMSALGALAMATLGLLRSTRPLVFPDRPTRFKIGSPGEFPSGTVREFPRHKAIVFSDHKGLYAISTVCTHLGCVVRWTEKGFECPCHGSKFDVAGQVIRGPAPRGLPWLSIEQLPNGRLAVDTSAHVSRGSKFRLS